MTPAAFKSIRLRAGLTQRVLAERVGVGPRHIRMLEAGDRKPGASLVKLMEQIDAEASLLMREKMK